MFKYFKRKDFACPHCGANNIQDVFIFKLDQARELAGVPFVINSGYRCPVHNKAVGGKPDSAHTKGLAADIKAENSSTRFHVQKGLFLAGFVRIGTGKGFVHADIDRSRGQEVSWLY